MGAIPTICWLSIVWRANWDGAPFCTYMIPKFTHLKDTELVKFVHKKNIYPLYPTIHLKTGMEFSAIHRKSPKEYNHSPSNFWKRHSRYPTPSKANFNFIPRQNLIEQKIIVLNTQDTVWVAPNRKVSSVQWIWLHCSVIKSLWTRANSTHFILMTSPKRGFCWVIKR